MSLFQLIAVLLTLAALFSYLNHRFIRLPTTIGLMFISLLFSVGLLVISQFGLDLESKAEAFLSQIDFYETLMEGMLGYLLFAGALHINFDDLWRQKWAIGILATVGVLCSAFLIAVLLFFILQILSIPIPFLYCLVFGALISPTDPIAVLGLLKQANAPKSLETKIAGESLFNDGVGVVIFLVVKDLAQGDHDPVFSHIVQLLAQEAIGGVLLGLVLGWVGYLLLKGVDHYSVEVLLTLALVTGGYALAGLLHVSGPLAVVTAGLLIGNHGRYFAMSETSRHHLDSFWEMVDEILTAVLFVLIGLELIIISLKTNYLAAGLLAIPAVLLARFISVGIPVNLLKLRRSFTPHAIKILTWGGLRGGISVALALSLQHGPQRDLLLTVTYVIVVFTILVQGLTVPRLLKKAVAELSSQHREG